MKIIFFAVIFITSLVQLYAGFGFTSSSSKHHSVKYKSGFAVIELFTSEGSAQDASVLGVQYRSFAEPRTTTRDPNDKIGDAGNVTNKFLNGTILNSDADGRIVITNSSLGSTLTFDMTIPDNPFRI